jgi:cerevisin
LLSFVKALPSRFFSKPTLDAELAPIPSPVSPALLKKALLLLSTPDALEDVGEGSPNLLIFNNFTKASIVMEKVWRQFDLEDALMD